MPRKKTSTNSGSRAADSFTVGFRFEDEEELRALEECAASRGLSVHLMARQLVQQALAGEGDELALQGHLIMLLKGLTVLRGDVATATEALLTNAGKVKPEQAKEWVNQKFRSVC